MIFRLLFIFLFFCVGSANADIKRTTESIATVDSLGSYTTITVPSQNTVFTKSFSLQNQDPSQAVGVMYKPTSSGTINISLEVQESFQPPTVEGVQDATYVSWKQLDTAINTAVWKAATLDTVTQAYGRFKIIGGSGNDASTTIQIKLGKK